MISTKIPKLEQTGEQSYRLLEPLVFYNPVAQALEFVPEGFETNLLSIPKLFRPFIHPAADIRAAIIHDYLYTYRIVPRIVADHVFLTKLIADEHVNNTVAYACFVVVRAFGWKYYGKSGFANFESQKAWEGGWRS